MADPNPPCPGKKVKPKARRMLANPITGISILMFRVDLIKGNCAVEALFQEKKTKKGFLGCFSVTATKVTGTSSS